MAKPEKTLTRPAARTFSPAFFETGDKTAVLRPIRKRGRSQKRIKMDTLKSANYIKEKRLALGLRESDVAASLGVSSYEVNGWEAGFFPDVEYLLPLAELLQVSVDEILKGEDNPLPPQAKEDESAAIEEKSASAEFSRAAKRPDFPTFFPFGSAASVFAKVSSEDEKREKLLRKAPRNDAVYRRRRKAL